MRKKITIYPEGKDAYQAELIMEFEIIESGKKYVVYTMNEPVNENLVQIYVAGIDNVNGEDIATDQISDEEWARIKEIMKEVLSGGNENEQV